MPSAWPPSPAPRTSTSPRAHGDRINFGDRFVEVRATPGHTDGCISFVLDDQLVLLGVILSQTVAPGWIWLSGFCGRARLLAAMPWNRVAMASPRK